MLQQRRLLPRCSDSCGRRSSVINNCNTARDRLLPWGLLLFRDRDPGTETESRWQRGLRCASAGWYIGGGRLCIAECGQIMGEERERNKVEACDCVTAAHKFLHLRAEESQTKGAE